MDALGREIGEEVGIEAPPLEGPIAIVDSIAPGRALTTKHVVHIIFAGDVEGSLEAVTSHRRGGARAPAVRLRRARRDRPPPADPAVPGALAVGRSSRLSWGVLDTEDRAVKRRSCLAGRPSPTADYAAQFLATLADRPVGAQANFDELVDALGGPLPEEGQEDVEVVAELIAAAEPGLVGIADAAATSAS